MHELSLNTLSLITGGQQAPAASTPPSRGDDAPITRKELEDRLAEQERFYENERFREWERNHPFSALICQGDRDCAGFR